MDSKKNVFVIMPFQEEFFEMYEMLKMEFADNYEFTNAGEEGNQQNILRDIIEPIYQSDIVIADLTGLNPNVMYELGIAHTFNKKTIVITKDDLAQLPFDLKQYRAKDYSTHFKKFADLIEYLKVNMDGAVNGDVSYSNPVKDFMTLAGINNGSCFCETPLNLEDNTDKGFLDFLAEIEEKLSRRGADAPSATEKKDLRQQLKTLQEEITKEARRRLKECFDYQIAIAEVMKAGITTTGAACENELNPLAEEFRQYRINKNLWTIFSHKLEYILVFDKVKRVKEELRKNGKLENVECFL